MKHSRHTLILLAIYLALFAKAAAQKPQLVVQTGHGEPVYALAISPDNKLLASAGTDHKIIVWDIQRRKQLYSLTEHTQAVLSLAFNLEGNLLASGSVDGTAKIWDVKRGVRVENISLQKNGVTCVAFSPDGKYLAIAGTEKVINIWDIAARAETHTLRGFKKTVEKIVFSPDGNFLVSFARDHSLVAWDWKSGKASRVQLFKQKLLMDMALAISPDSKYVAAASHSSEFLLWNLSNDETESIPFPIDPSKKESVEIDNLAFTSNHELICDVEENIKRWDYRTKEVTTVADSSRAVHSSFSLSADSKLLAYSTDETVNTYELDTKNQREFTSGFQTIYNLEFYSEGRTLFASGRSYAIFGDGYLFDEDEGGRIAAGLIGSRYVYIPALNSIATYGEINGGYGSPEIELKGFIGNESMPKKTIKAHSASINSMSVHPEGKLLATCSKDKTIKIWDVLNWEKPTRIIAENARELTFSPDGKWLAVATEDRKIKLYDTTTWRSRFIYESDRGALGRLYFSADSSKVATHVGAGLGDQYLIVRSIADNYHHRIFKLDNLPSNTKLEDLFNLVPFPGLTLISMIGDYTANKQTRGSLSFSKDKESRFIAYQYKDLLRAVNTVKVWDLKTGNEVAHLIGHGGIIRSTAFSPNSRILASGSNDTTIKLWDIEKREELATIFTLDNEKWVIQTPAGRFDTNTDLEDPALMHWSIPGNALTSLPLDVLMRDYFEPKLFERLLACVEDDNCKEEFREVRDLSKVNIIRPEVKILDVSLPDADRNVNVRVEVSNTSGEVERADGQRATRTSGVYDLRLFRNRQLVETMPSDSAEKIERQRAQIEKVDRKLRFEAELKVWRESTKVSLDPRTGKQTVTFRVRLPKGKDASSIDFSAYAFNEDRVKSPTTRYKWTPEQEVKLPKADPKTKKYAYVVSVGVNDFKVPGFSLTLSNYDAEQFQTTVTEKLRQTGQYEVVPIPLISASKDGKVIDQATKENVKAVFALLAGKPVSGEIKGSVPNFSRIRRATPDDFIIVSFSSHGYSIGGDFYLLPSDITKRNEEQDFPDLESMISGEELALWLGNIDADQIAWIIDACKSAALVEGLHFKPGPLGSRGFGQLAYDKLMRVLVATQADNYALQVDGKIRGGLLTEALITEGLIGGKADVEKDGKIMLDEWLGYGETRVPALFRDAVKEVETIQTKRPTWVLKNVGKSRDLNAKEQKRLQRASFFNFSQKSSGILISLTNAN